MFRKLLLVLLVVVGLAVIAFAVLLVITPAAPIAEQPSPKPAVERRKAALQADAEGQYVPGYHFVVGPLRFSGFSLRPEALVTFAQTGSGAEEVAGCLEATITAVSIHLRCESPEVGVVTIEGDRKSTRLNSSHSQISYAVFCLKKKTASESPHIYNTVTVRP